MSNTDKAKSIIKLLKKGYSPKEVTELMAVSYNYAWKLKKDLEAAAQEAMRPVKETILSVDNTGYPDITPEFAFSLSQGRQKRREEAEADTNVDAILNERAGNYGSFKDVAGCAQEIKNAIRMCNNSELDDDQVEALDMIASKIARIVNGNPNHTDSWIDIAGYATLVADRLQGKIR
jgi:hypothetical protein